MSFMKAEFLAFVDAVFIAAATHSRGSSVVLEELTNRPSHTAAAKSEVTVSARPMVWLARLMLPT